MLLGIHQQSLCSKCYIIRGPDIEVLAEPVYAFNKGSAKTEISGPLII